MAIFELPSGIAVNPNYIIIVGKVTYNETSEKYYFTLVLSSDGTTLNIDFDNEHNAKTERNRLINHMRK